MTRFCVAYGPVFFVFGLVLAEAARAEPPAPPEERREADAASQQKAEELFAEGSTLYQQWQFVHAEQKYREALTHWEHPVIYLYLSRALEKQGHLESAYKVLQQALRRSPELLSPEDNQVAENLRMSLESRLAQIEVHCADAGAEVLLDGVPWFTAPGLQRKRLHPGKHVIIARKVGYHPVTEVATLLPGKQTRVEVRMSARVAPARPAPSGLRVAHERMSAEIRVERRWQPWIPWTVVSGSVFSSAVGGLLLRASRNDYAALGKAFTHCEGRPFCRQVSIQRRDSGAWKEVMGSGLLIVGGSAAVIGLAGVLLNQPHSYRSGPSDSVKLHFAPMVSGAGTGVFARISF
jgi:hypothetical protein